MDGTYLFESIVFCGSRFVCVVAEYNQFVAVVEKEKEIKEFQCNVALTGLEIGEYTSDFVCVKENGDLRVRECVDRKYLMKPLTVKLLEASREYWRRNGVADWGMVINEEK